MATKARSLEQQEVQRGQLDDLKTRILSERATSKREGEMLKMRAVEEEQELKQKEQVRIGGRAELLCLGCAV